MSNANHVNRKSSPIPNEDPVEPPPYQEIHSNGFAHKFDEVNTKIVFFNWASENEESFLVKKEYMFNPATLKCIENR